MKKILLLGASAMLFSITFGQCDITYVSTSGIASGTGTTSDPIDISTAFTTAASGEIIRIAIGTYNIDNSLTINFDNIIIEGGFIDTSSWAKTSLAGATTINRTALNPEGSANDNRLVSLYANGVSGFEIHDVTITTDNASDPGTSTYGLHLENCANYSIVRCQILPGNATNGLSGVDGIDGDPGMPGGNGANGDIDDNSSGGTGGIGGAGGGIGGGTQSAGGVNPVGDGNTGAPGPNGMDSGNSLAGGAGGGGGSGGETDHNGGNGGQGGGVNLGVNQTGGGMAGNWGDPGGDGSNGVIGATGTNGINGSNGSSGSYATFYTTGSQGSNGTNGTGGKGGVGGGGGGGQSCFFCNDGSGDGGGGGGGGGEAGTAGTGGHGGGASFGIYLYNNGANGLIENCTVAAGNLGSGGSGGSGGTGGQGGNKGNGSTYGTAEVGEGGDGGIGGNGGNGGLGGSGSTGTSVDVQLTSGGTLLMEDITFDLASQHVIVVSFVTCTRQSATFQDDSLAIGTGNTSWDFGVNATTQLASDNPSSTAFNVVGMNDIIQAADTYIDFVNITCSVDGSATQVGNTLTANTSGSTYQWVDCNNGYSVIPGATTQSYTPSMIGDFAVIATSGDCSDTSACFSITSVGIDEIGAGVLSLYPNPTNGQLTLTFAHSNSSAVIRVLDLSGRLVDQFTVENTLQYHYELTAPSGSYVIEVLSNSEYSIHRIVKN